MLKIGKLYKCKIDARHFSADFFLASRETINISLLDKPLLYLGEQPSRDCAGTVGHRFLIDGMDGYFPFRTFKPKYILEEIEDDET